MQPPPAAPAAGAERQPEPAPERQPAPAPDLEPFAEPTPESACVDTRSWFAGKEEIEVAGRIYQPLGFPRPVDRRYLVRVGEYDQVPVYASMTAQWPYADIWLPRCGTEELYELYMAVGTP